MKFKNYGKSLLKIVNLCSVVSILFACDPTRQRGPGKDEDGKLYNELQKIEEDSKGSIEYFINKKEYKKPETTPVEISSTTEVDNRQKQIDKNNLIIEKGEKDQSVGWLKRGWRKITMQSTVSQKKLRKAQIDNIELLLKQIDSLMKLNQYGKAIDKYLEFKLLSDNINKSLTPSDPNSKMEALKLITDKDKLKSYMRFQKIIDNEETKRTILQVSNLDINDKKIIIKYYKVALVSGNYNRALQILEDDISEDNGKNIAKVMSYINTQKKIVEKEIPRMYDNYKGNLQLRLLDYQKMLCLMYSGKKRGASAILNKFITDIDAISSDIDTSIIITKLLELSTSKYGNMSEYKSNFKELEKKLRLVYNKWKLYFESVEENKNMDQKMAMQLPMMLAEFELYYSDLDSKYLNYLKNVVKETDKHLKEVLNEKGIKAFEDKKFLKMFSYLLSVSLQFEEYITYLKWLHLIYEHPEIGIGKSRIKLMIMKSLNKYAKKRK